MHSLAKTLGCHLKRSQKTKDVLEVGSTGTPVDPEPRRACAADPDRGPSGIMTGQLPTCSSAAPATETHLESAYCAGTNPTWRWSPLARAASPHRASACTNVAPR